ncbi:hypothetical protein A9Q79_07945 [Methylophaga sp. 42_25_T18]|nr:hypothetical protein A9Q79_07945 [Methylophaga sp. 42_25_T18]
MSENYFLWPKSRYLRGGFRGLKKGTTSDIELLLKQRYSSGVPVIVSSARVGIVLALMAQKLTRPDYVGIFPFASHCVIESVGRVATPIPAELSQHDNISLIYHQWGYIQQRTSLNTRIIEDAVDSFCHPGSELFPLNGMYEIWSLPKLIGSLGGGVVWCRDEQSAEDIKALRDNNKLNTQPRWLLKLLASYWPRFESLWFSAESAGGPLPKWATGDILYGLESWDKIEHARRERIQIVQSLLPEWLELPDSRLPSVIPIEVSEEKAKLLIEKGFSAGYRTFEKFNEDQNSELVRLFPLYVHQDIPCELLESSRKILQ